MLRSTRNSFRKIAPVLSIIGALSIAPIASAAVQLHFDLNSVTTAFSPAITNAGTYTGTITISKNSSSYLEGIDFDGVNQTINGTLTAVSGTLYMTSGAISSSPASSLTFTIKNSDNSLHTYTGTFDEIDGQAMSFVEGDVNPSYLNSTNFAGVNVSQFALQNVDGAVVISNFPGTTTNLDVYLLPEPAVGLVGLLALVATRIRSRRV